MLSATVSDGKRPCGGRDEGARASEAFGDALGAHRQDPRLVCAPGCSGAMPLLELARVQGSVSSRHLAGQKSTVGSDNERPRDGGDEGFFW